MVNAAHPRPPFYAGSAARPPRPPLGEGMLTRGGDVRGPGVHSQPTAEAAAAAGVSRAGGGAPRVR